MGKMSESLQNKEVQEVTEGGSEFVKKEHCISEAIAQRNIT